MRSSGPVLNRGRYRVRLAQTPKDIAAAQALRAQSFGVQGADCDLFDQHCLHVLLEETQTGRLVCCFRLLLLQNGAELERSYSAQFYDLAGLVSFEGRIAELGRFCVRPGRQDPDILRAAWGALTAFVDKSDVKMLIGCSSFSGVQADAYLDSFAFLKAHHLAPKQWLPQVRAPDVYPFGKTAPFEPDEARAMAQMPPLLRTYLTMGGWVSDHAVVDHEMNTLHVFTGLEVRAIPPRRKRLLRQLASWPNQLGVDDTGASV